MSHSCASLLCESPHYFNDDHSSNCLCEMCHEHDFAQYMGYPDCCEGCLDTLSQWIHENTDLPRCQFPELCTYSKECKNNLEAHDELTD